MTQIDILLSLYNGKNYLLELLESLSSQNEKNFQLIIRDDGSRDHCLEMAVEYLKQSSLSFVVLSENNNIGVIKSFEKLMQSSTAPYIMFCDQDDVWLPNKVSHTLQAMKQAEQENPNTPLLVHTDLHLVNSDLQTIHPSMWQYQKLSADKGKQLNRALMQNTVTGCTMMINRTLLQLVPEFPKMTLMHDWYLAITAAAFGKIVPLKQALILYRQHANNTVGGQKYGWKALLKKRKTQKRSPITDACLQGEAFLAKFSGKLLPEKKQILVAFSSLISPSSYLPIYSYTIIKRGFWKSGVFRNLALLMGIGR